VAEQAPKLITKLDQVDLAEQLEDKVILLVLELA
jgi:hypothetical protein